VPDNELSEREREILRLVATGASNKEIAQQLFITTNTVKVHLRNIFAKIGVASRTEATVYAIREGLIQVEGVPRVEEPVAALPMPMEPTLPTSVAPAVPTGKLERAQLPRWWIAAGALAVLLVVVVGLASAMRQPAATVSASPAAPTPRPRWQARAALPTPRSGLAAATYENRIYVIGGEAAQGITGVVERYDPTSDTWITLSSKPTAVTDVTATVVGGQIYVPGGCLDSEHVRITDRLEVYDPRQDRWEERARLPKPVSAYALTTFEGKIYLFGGWDGSRYIDSAYEYDPRRDSWRTLSPMSEARGYAGAAVVGGKIFVIGGYDGRDPSATNEAYLPERDNGGDTPWIQRVSLPTGRYGMGVASISNIIYVIGGEGEPGSELLPLGYSQEDDKWQPFESPFPKQWSYLVTLPLGTQLYSIGGKLEGMPTSQNMAYQALYTILIPVLR
jgi:DNA-binding CsgD family transcriptional regulator/N-acetylneuraminic acid mutarotase